MIDEANTSGFFPHQNNGVVAILTLHNSSSETQALAFSRDGGYTFEYYKGNPVIDAKSTSFRDPKVGYIITKLREFFQADLQIGILARFHQKMGDGSCLLVGA